MTENNNERKTKYAWAQYYAEINSHIATTTEVIRLVEAAKQNDVSNGFSSYGAFFVDFPVTGLFENLKSPVFFL